jgi:PII-like signaling protein
MAKETYNGKLVRIYCSETDEWQGKRLYEAILDKCLEIGIAGATVYRGLEGFGFSAEIHKLRIWPFANKDAPVMVSIIDREEVVARLLPVLDEMLIEGLVATSDVQIIRYAAGDESIQGM